MNHDCNGDEYELDRRTYYRCLRDGVVVSGPVGELCTNCGRPAFPKKRGEVRIRLVAETQVYIEPFGWVSHARLVNALSPQLVPRG